MKSNLVSVLGVLSLIVCSSAFAGEMADPEMVPADTITGDQAKAMFDEMSTDGEAQDSSNGVTTVIRYSGKTWCEEVQSDTPSYTCSLN